MCADLPILGDVRFIRRPMRPPTDSQVTRRAGFSLVEVAVMLVILTIALGMFARTMASAKKLDPVATETAIAASAARSALEQMRNHAFQDIFVLFNSNPNDDPGGVGTAPGPHFTVEELKPKSGVAWVGTISFPSLESALREDVEDPMLGMPRDLNADGVIDSANHAGDCMILPIRVRLEWIAKNSQSVRTFEMYTMYARF